MKNGYIAIYNRVKIEIHADTLFAAKTEAISKLRVPKSKIGMLVVVLCKKGDEQVNHCTSEV